MRTTLYYTLYNESLELNPEKPEGGERRAEYNISIEQITGVKFRKNLKKGVKNAKDKISHI
jgi:hypothetical protein